MTNQDKPKAKTSDNQSFKELLLSGTWTAIAALITAIITLLTDLISTLRILSKIPNQYFVFIAILVSLVTIIPISLQALIRYYKIQTLQTEKAIRRLKEKEAEFFSDVEANWTVLTGKAQ